VNRHYLVRGAQRVQQGLTELRRQRPTVEPRTTFFFAAIPEFAGFQVGDGPLVRWAYRDTSLRSFFLSELTTERAQRGPALFFAADERGLREIASNQDLRDLAVSIVHGEKLERGRDALTLVLNRFPADNDTRYWRAWTSLALGDSAAAISDLTQIGFRFDVEKEEREPRKPNPNNDPHTDSLLAIRDLDRDVESDPWNARKHSRLADLLLAQPEFLGAGAAEAFAARVLAPEAAASWRRWGAVLLAAERLEMAVPALERAVALSEKPDPALNEVLEGVRRALKEEPVAARATPGSAPPDRAGDSP
jgi:tetratricopeptide (TPR) repeat protein